MTSFIKIVVVVSFLTSCDASFISSGNNSSPLRLELDITSEGIKTIQDIEADFTVTNTSYDVVTLGFSSSCQHGFKIEKDEDTLFNSKNEIGCLAVLTELKLAPQESKTYQISLRGMASNDTLQTGKYQIKAFLLNEESPETRITFEVK